jgi:hypothetical protein
MTPPKRLRRLPVGLEEGHFRGPWGDTGEPAEPAPRCPLGSVALSRISRAAESLK